LSQNRPATRLSRREWKESRRRGCGGWDEWRMPQRRAPELTDEPRLLKVPVVSPVRRGPRSARRRKGGLRSGEPVPLRPRRRLRGRGNRQTDQAPVLRWMRNRAARFAGRRGSAAFGASRGVRPLVLMTAHEGWAASGCSGCEGGRGRRRGREGGRT
jgi:hypothetical protein